MLSRSSTCSLSAARCALRTCCALCGVVPRVPRATRGEGALPAHIIHTERTHRELHSSHLLHLSWKRCDVNFHAGAGDDGVLAGRRATGAIVHARLTYTSQSTSSSFSYLIQLPNAVHSEARRDACGGGTHSTTVGSCPCSRGPEVRLVFLCGKESVNVVSALTRGSTTQPPLVSRRTAEALDFSIVRVEGCTRSAC